MGRISPEARTVHEVIVRSARSCAQSATPANPASTDRTALKARTPGLTRGHVTVYIRDTTLA